MRKSYGFTLIETILAMWITAILAFSTMVCITSIGATTDQHKNQALSLSRSEMSIVKYMFSNSNAFIHDECNNLKYTKVIWLPDKIYMKRRRIIDFSKLFLPEMVFTESNDQIYRTFFQEANETSKKYNIPTGLKVGEFIKGIKQGGRGQFTSNVLKNLLDSYKAECPEIKSLIAAIKDGKANSQIDDNPERVITPFIVDVEITPYEENGINNKNSRELNITTGWFENNNGSLAMNYNIYSTVIHLPVMKYSEI